MNNDRHITDSGTDTPRRIAIGLHPGGADVLICEGNKTSVKKITTDSIFTDESKILEEVVYNMPQLLDEPGIIDIIVSSNHFLVIPGEIADDNDALNVTAKAMWTDVKADNIIVNHTAAGVAILHSTSSNIAGYTARTFAKAAITHRMALLIDLCTTQSRPIKDVKMYIFFNADTSLDIIAFGAETLLMANTFCCHGGDDEFYFISAAAKDCGFDQVDDEMVFAGDITAHSDIIERLQCYYNSVTPMIVDKDVAKIPLQFHSIINNPYQQI